MTQDIGRALHALTRRPGFTAIAVATLAIGIGSNAAVFSVVDAALLRPLQYPRAEQLVMPWEYSAEVQQRTGFDRLPSSPADVTDFITRNRTFQGLASIRSERLNLTGTGDPERIAGVRVSREFFDVLGVRATLGRTFSEIDGPGARIVVIAQSLWQRRFGAEPAILGEAIRLNGEPATVVGVLPAWFRFPAAGELPMTLGFSSDPEVWTLDILTAAQQQNRGAKSFALIGRLREDASLAAAQADLGAIAADISGRFPASNAGWTVRVLPLREQLVGGIRPALTILLAAVGFVLLIACANVANLLLVRAAARQREVWILHALGADRRRLIRQLLAESLLLSLVSAAIGVLAAWWVTRLLLAVSPSSIPALSHAALDWRVAGFTLAVAVVTALAFGALPAAQMTRGNAAEGLREGNRSTVGGRRAHRTRSTLVVLEVALALVLLVGALLLLNAFVRLIKVDAGFRTDGVLTMEVALPRSSYPDPSAAEFFARLIARLTAIPGVEAAAVTSGLPLSGPENLRQVTIEGRPRPEAGQEIVSDYRAVTPDYFRIMGIPSIAGESLPADPLPNTPLVLLVNMTMARTAWPDADPVGRRLKLTTFDQNAPWFTVAGVVGDTRHTALDSSPRPQVYVHQRVDPFQQMVVVLRTSGDPSAYAAAARAAVLELDRNQPVGRIRAMRNVLAESVASRRFLMSLVSVFAALALVLSVVGLYAVIAQSVAERTREMGLRLALGATPSNLRTAVLGDGMRLVAIGVAVGLAIGYALLKSSEALLFGATPIDVMPFVTVPLILFVCGALGCLIPARRAMRVDPMIALRAE